jgi:oligopeptide/dipeptide ABC transporter ATP-binding protein
VSAPLLQVCDLRTWFPLRSGMLSRVHGYVKAVNDVSFELKAGEVLGLVGESGCGKSTLGRSIVGLERTLGGSVTFDGQDIAALGKSARRHMQMIFQDPASSLNPRLTVMEAITEGPRHHGLLDTDAKSEALRLLSDVGLGEDALYRYPHEFSGGQRQRISIARALSVQPRFIVCDEAVSALDVSVQAQVLNLLCDLREKYGLAFLFISHDLSVTHHIADRIAVMYLGRIVETGPASTIVRSPQHPYTKALIDAVPVPGAARRGRQPLSGELPSAANPPPGCPFHTRCPEAMDRCKVDLPSATVVGNGHSVNCHARA